MSLIDEALKRAQKAHQEKTPEAGRPWTPTPLPERPRRAPLGVIVVVSVVVAAALTAAVFLYLTRARSAPVSRASAVLQASSSAAGLPPITSEVTVAPPPGNVASGPPMRALREAATPRPVSTRVQPAAPSPVSFAPIAPSGPSARAATEPAIFVGEMPVPGGGKISLEGIAYSEASPVAVLNGKIVALKGYVEGFTVVTILPDRVELEAEGKKVFLKLR